MAVLSWFTDKYIEVFGVVAGIIYVFLEIRQTIWLWPVGIITSAVYIWIFFTSKLYADMSLQGYYLIISCLGWYWWLRGVGAQGSGAHKEQSDEVPQSGRTEREREEGIGREKNKEKNGIQVTRIKVKTGIVLAIVFILLFIVMRTILTHFTDSPVPGWDSFITSLSIVATWMLARKIYEHWFLWIVVNFVSVGLFISRGLYPTVFLYLVYGFMSFAGLLAWKKTIKVT